MKKQVVIFGAGGFGREVLQLVRDIEAAGGEWSCAGFIVDQGLAAPSEVAGLPVLGDMGWLVAHPEVHVVVAIGSSAARNRVVRRIRACCANPFAILAHPRAWIGANVQIGPGSVICAGALVTTDIRIAEHVHVNIGCTIGHDAVLADFVTLNPSVNISGNVCLQEGSEVGTGSVVIPGCTVGRWAIVGAGSVVTKQIPADSTVVGAPARVVKERAAGWHETP
jgi:sugar O-acyltransferase (sialic acid O-acetyltransferase NeuD family)